MIPFRSVQDAEAGSKRVRDHLNEGGLIAYPTETVYGFGGKAQSADVHRLADLKTRAKGTPFLLLAANRGMIENMDLDLSGFAGRLADAFWPGPLTLVLRGGSAKLPEGLCGPQGGVAVRVTSQPVIAHLIESLDYPITSTSANRLGRPPAFDANQIATEFEDAVNTGRLLILDGGELPERKPSTVVDCTGEHPDIIREGVIAIRDVMECAKGAQ